MKNEFSIGGGYYRCRYQLELDLCMYIFICNCLCPSIYLVHVVYEPHQLEFGWTTAIIERIRILRGGDVNCLVFILNTQIFRLGVFTSLSGPAILINQHDPPIKSNQLKINLSCSITQRKFSFPWNKTKKLCLWINCMGCALFSLLKTTFNYLYFF